MSQGVSAAPAAPPGAPPGQEFGPDGTPPERRKRLAPQHIDVALFALGMLLHLVAYLSFVPLLLAFIYFSAAMALLSVPRVGGGYERRIYSRVFAVGFVMAGVAAVYANFWNDPSQLASDADTFFLLASGQTTGIAIEDLRVFFEGALAIVIWGAIYDFFTYVGFPRERFVGILFNVTVVAITAALTLKIARQLYGHDPYRFRRLTLLFAACGLFWMFASIHIRDGVVLLVVTALVYAWLYFLARPDLGIRLLQLVAGSLVAAFFLTFLRREFVFVPLAMAVAGVAALMLGEMKGNRWTGYVLFVAGLAAVAGLLVSYGDAIRLALMHGQEGYLELASTTNDASSLGMALIVNQPLPVRLVIGSATIFLFPIPFWLGFQLESVYHLYKSCNVVFFYFLLPLLGLAARELWKNKAQRTPAFLFILFVTIGFTIAIAGTSLESRHFGAFLAPVLVMALRPDLRLRAVRHNYRQLLFLVLGSVVLVHGLWLFLKIT